MLGCKIFRSSTDSSAHAEEAINKWLSENEGRIDITHVTQSNRMNLIITVFYQTSSTSNKS
jgi:hypothetical protein